MPRKKQGKVMAKEPQVAGRAESTRITPVDIQQKEFGLAFRGYNERDVDQFLDELTEEVARLYAENKRLREELEFARTSRMDLSGAEEADALLRQAREEAARLLADARARASATDPGAVGPGGRGTAAALAPFVAQEREFLQSLANLIQTHAEAVKDQIRRARDAAAQASAREATAQAAAREASTQAAAREATAREAAAREAAARAALQEEAAAQAAFREASSTPPKDEASEGSSEALGKDEGSGPPTQSWTEDALQASGSQEWMDYYVSGEEEEDSEAGGGSSDQILDLTEASGERSGAGGEDGEEGDMGRRRLEPQGAAREAEPADDDALEDRSIRELFWGEDY